LGFRKVFGGHFVFRNLKKVEKHWSTEYFDEQVLKEPTFSTGAIDYTIQNKNLVSINLTNIKWF
jgi:hypothetical protein